MVDLIIKAYEIITVTLPFLLIYFIFNRNRKKSIKAFIPYLVFIIYIYKVLNVTGSGAIYEGIRRNFEISSKQINLILFSQSDISLFGIIGLILPIPIGFLCLYFMKTKSRKFNLGLGIAYLFLLFLGVLFTLVKGGSIVGHSLNIVMFIPFGFLLPYLWKKTNNLMAVTIYSFFFSLVIELSQLLNVRATDVDDLLMNTLGGIVGFIIFKMYCKVKSRSNTRTMNSKPSPAIYIGAMFLGKFLLFNSMGLLNLFYDFQ
ncbi:VanZ family protein [Miniphocaeibacter halophilus]|uniref:VanZ family protein n=1 Tax=Miniphocaeibacter halophilus TaxID=2931922 RepID=A0AC61MTV4_9FIRM|nr:VanZ family protein [Miniphocaeibacter halophilus]QQK08987.1 VanZ family protein [Miniphocaeibacter halophilus]